MSGALGADPILDQAVRSERDYDWLGAIEFHKKALGFVSEQDFRRMGEIYEKLGYAFYRASMQAESIDEFKERLHESAANYEKAKQFFGILSKQSGAPRALRCDAMIAYMGYWLASEVPEKRRLLDASWRLTQEALKAFKEAGEVLEHGKTYNQLSSSAFFGYSLEWNFQVREKIIKEALEHGEHAITLLSGAGDPHELARAYVKAAMYLTIVGLYFISDMDEKGNYHQKSLEYWQKAIELSEETALLELLTISGENLDWRADEILTHYEKALCRAEKAKDKYLIGNALDWMAYAGFWKATGIEAPDERSENLQRALRYAEGAKHQFLSISFVSPRGGALWAAAPYFSYYLELAQWEINLRKKRDLLEKAKTDGAHAIKKAENAGCPEPILTAHYILSNVLVSSAQVETDAEEKKRLLEKALEHVCESTKLIEQFQPFSFWNRGAMWSTLADLKAESSNVEKNSQKIKSMLEEAISDKERALQLCIKESLHFEKKGDLSLSTVLGFFRYSYGELLNRLYGLTNNNEYQRKAIRAFEEAAESHQKLNLPSRMAECRWKTARGYDALGEHLNAAKNFNLASNNYVNAAEKIPQLKSFYEDHALYMQAWSEIENARDNHAGEEYCEAKEHYKKAADLHRSTEHWNYLSHNYSAWAKLEEAEGQSRKDKTEEARDLFQEAAKLFVEAKKPIQAQLEKVENKDEKELLDKLTKASDIRREYCLGRATLEEAKILNREGNHAVSSRKYGSAAEKFQKAIDAIEDESDRQELKPIACLCRAWQLMMQAEAEASPDLYMEASKLFDEAKEYGANEKGKLLALGHSCFCKALEAGTRFEATRDMKLRLAATRQLEGAANYYVRAGFETASEYVRATLRLFDAYMYIDKAQTEADPKTKAQYYQMSEKLLQASAGSYLKAKHPAKSEEVGRLLENVKEERQLVVSLAEAFYGATIASTTASFSTPTPAYEQAVGLERFEHADVQANLIIGAKEAKVGEEVNIELELVNAGKAPALLVKVEEIVPESFQVREVPEIYRVEDGYLNMKGKRLDPLKTEAVKMVVQPQSRGVFTMKPRILYVDETGKNKSHEPEPMTITVKELGILGWIKGKR